MQPELKPALTLIMAAKVSDDGDDGGDEDRNLVWSATVPIPQDQLHTVGKYMTLILVAYTEIGAHARSNLYLLICLRHLIRSRAVTNRRFIRKDILYKYHV